MRPGVLAVFVFLAGCPTVDQGDPPVTPGSCLPDQAQFDAEVWPMAVATGDAASCVQAGGCHRREDGRSALRLIEIPASPSDFLQNYQVVTRFLNCSTPSVSPFVTKPKTGEDPHSGGDLWTCDGSAQPCTLVEEWISGG